MDVILNNVGAASTRALPHIYHQSPSKYYARYNGVWQELLESSVVKLLVNQGWNPRGNTNRPIPETDTGLMRIQRENRVDAAVKLGWKETGLQEMDGKRVLVLDGGKFIQPSPGEWTIINQLVANLFLPEEQVYFFGWLQNGVQSLYGLRTQLYGQALVLAGPKGGGKSFLQLRVISPLFGGKSAKPFSWLTGQTAFNSELFEAMHQMVEDEYYSADPVSRKSFGAAIKKMTANQVQELHRKHQPAFSCIPLWRLTISLNDELHNLAVLPELDESLSDKITILKTSTKPMPLSTAGDNPMEQAVAAELPHFLYYLLNEFKVPAHLVSPRYGIQAYINPEIRERLGNIGEENILLEEMRNIWAGMKTDLTTSQIAKALEVEVSPLVKPMLKSHRLSGNLHKLERMPGSGVREKKVNGGKRVWELDFS